MTEIAEAAVRGALKSVAVPTRGGGNVVELGMISGIVVKNGHVGFAIEIDPGEREALENVRRACEDAARALPHRAESDGTGRLEAARTDL